MTDADFPADTLPLMPPELPRGELNNARGKVGENFARSFFERLDFEKMFEVSFLGETWPTFDFLLEARVGEGPRPFAFLSVRATTQEPQAGGNLKVGLSAAEVARLNRHPAPTYLVGVDARGEPLVGFIASINDELDELSSLPPAYELNKSAAEALWDELVLFWRDRSASLPRGSRFRLPVNIEEDP